MSRTSVVSFIVRHLWREPPEKLIEAASGAQPAEHDVNRDQVCVSV